MLILAYFTTFGLNPAVTTVDNLLQRVEEQQTPVASAGSQPQGGSQRLALRRTGVGSDGLNAVLSNPPEPSSGTPNFNFPFGGQVLQDTQNMHHTQVMDRESPSILSEPREAGDTTRTVYGTMHHSLQGENDFLDN